MEFAQWFCHYRSCLNYSITKLVQQLANFMQSTLSSWWKFDWLTQSRPVYITWLCLWCIKMLLYSSRSDISKCTYQWHAMNCYLGCYSVRELNQIFKYRIHHGQCRQNLKLNKPLIIIASLHFREVTVNIHHKCSCSFCVLFDKRLCIFL